MRVCFLALLVLLLSLSSIGVAQESGSVVAGLDIGITSALGDFKNDSLQAGTGFGLGAELKYSLFNGFSVGPFVRYHRFGSDIQSTDGNISYNFTQYGALAKMNMFNVDKGRIYFIGGGGFFKPNRHTWTPDYIVDDTWDTGTFFMGGIGVSSNPLSTTIFEFEMRYNIGSADYVTLNPATLEEISEDYKFNFVYCLVKFSFNSKGKPAPPRY